MGHLDDLIQSAMVAYCITFAVVLFFFGSGLPLKAYAQDAANATMAPLGAEVFLIQNIFQFAKEIALTFGAVLGVVFALKKLINRKGRPAPDFGPYGALPF